MSFSFKVAIAFLSILFCAPLGADTIILRSGQTISGSIVGQNRTSITIRSEGKFRRIAKSNIKTVKYESAEKIQEQQKKLDERQAEIAKRLERLKQAKSARLQREREELEKLKNELEEQRKEMSQEMERMRQWRKEYEDWKREEEDAARVTGGRAMWRSALFPGWGHYYADQTRTGVIHTSLFVGSLAYFLSSRSAAASAKSNYENGTLLSTAGAAYIGSDSTLTIGGLSGGTAGTLLFGVLDKSNGDAYKSKISSANTSAILLGVVYLANVIHAYLTGSSIEAAAEGKDAWNSSSPRLEIFVHNPPARVGRASEVEYRIGLDFRF